MPWWILLTLFSAAMQTIRTGMQKSLKQELDDYAVTWVRFGFALPLVPLWLLGLLAAGIEIPSANAHFLLAAMAAGVLQIIATVMLVALFSWRNFAVCTAFAKTEAAQVAVLGALFFGETMSELGVVGVSLGGVGVILMLPFGGAFGWRTAAGWRATFLGLGAGAGFALTALFIRQAVGALDGAHPLAAAGLTLAVMIVLQTAVLGIFLLYRGAPWAALWRVRRRAAWVGLSGFLGSLGWATAFALTNPALVKTLAQVELPLAYLLGRTAFREKLRPLEVVGMIACAIAAVLVAFA